VLSPSLLPLIATRPTASQPIRASAPAIPKKEHKERVVSSRLQRRDGSIFEHNLIESGGVAVRRNPWANAGSLVFQVFILGFLVLPPLFHTAPLPNTRLLTLLCAPPPPALAAPVSTTRPKTSTGISTQISIPDPKAVSLPEERVQPADGAMRGVVGGVPGGMPGGVPGGVLGEVLRTAGNAPRLTDPSSMAPKKIHVAPRVAEGNLIHDVLPEYPAEAGRGRIEGTVVLMAVIDRDGFVRDVRVQSGVPLLAKAAIDAVKQWRYRPYLLNGEPVEVDTQITINFTLAGG
jgi:periplasmic protein TonB